MARLNELRSQLNIERVRGSGLLIGFDLKELEGATLVNRCLERGVLINSPGERTIRLMPPLIVSEEEVERSTEQAVDVVTTEILNAISSRALSVGYDQFFGRIDRSGRLVVAKDVLKQCILSGVGEILNVHVNRTA